MWGVAFMAVAVFGVVFIFMNMCLERMAVKQYQESYGIELQSGFVGDSIKVYVNDSLLYKRWCSAIALRFRYAVSRTTRC